MPDSILLFLRRDFFSFCKNMIKKYLIIKMKGKLKQQNKWKNRVKY